MGYSPLFNCLTKQKVPLLRLPRETERRMCVICQKIFPEIAQREPPLITLPAPITLPSIQHSLPQSYGTADQTSSKDLLDLAYQALATELVKLTGVLGRYDTGSKDYNDYLTLINRVVETMHTMRK